MPVEAGANDATELDPRVRLQDMTGRYHSILRRLPYVKSWDDKAAEGGMGGFLRIEVDPELFVEPYIFSHITGGEMSPNVVGILGTYNLEDDEFKAEVKRRTKRIVTNRTTDPASHRRLSEELFSREKELVDAGFVMGVKIPSVMEGEDKKRFEDREIPTLYKLRGNKHVVQFYAVDHCAGVSLLFEECFEGKTLNRVIPRGGMAPEQALGIFITIATGLKEAHEVGVVHRVAACRGPPATRRRRGRREPSAHDLVRLGRAHAQRHGSSLPCRRDLEDLGGVELRPLVRGEARRRGARPSDPATGAAARGRAGAAARVDRSRP